MPKQSYTGNSFKKNGLVDMLDTLNKPLRLFHFTTVLLEPGSRIGPGNWGRTIREYDFIALGNPVTVASEWIIESVRRDHFAQLPSRLNCNFMFTDEIVAKMQRPKNFAINQVLYEVKIVDPDAAFHRGAFNLFDVRIPGPGMSFVEHAERVADAYWRGTEIVVEEALTASPIEIVRMIE